MWSSQAKGLVNWIDCLRGVSSRASQARHRQHDRATRRCPYLIVRNREELEMSERIGVHCHPSMPAGCVSSEKGQVAEAAATRAAGSKELFRGRGEGSGSGSERMLFGLDSALSIWFAPSQS